MSKTDKTTVVGMCGSAPAVTSVFGAIGCVLAGILLSVVPASADEDQDLARQLSNPIGKICISIPIAKVKTDCKLLCMARGLSAWRVV